MADELTPGDQADAREDRPAGAGITTGAAPEAGVPEGEAGVPEGEGAGAGVPVAKARFEPLERTGAVGSNGENLDVIMDLELEISIQMGRTRMKVKDVLALSVGAIIELDKMVGEPMDIYANDRVIARGEVIVVDEDFGIRVTEIVNREEGREA